MITELWAAIGFMVLIALLILWWPYARNSQIKAQSNNARNEANKDSYLTSLEKIDTQRAENRINQQEYDELKTELGRKLLQEASDSSEQLEVKPHSMLFPIILSGLLASASIYMYLNIGESQHLEQAMAQNAKAKSQQEKYQQALSLLEEKVAQNPNNSEMLFNLAHFYISAQQFDNAIASFKKLITMVGEHAEFIGPQAQALYYKNNQQMTDEVKQLIEQALALDPNDVSTLVLVGMDNFVNGNYGQAIVVWQRVVNNDRPGTDIDALTNAIANAKQRLAMTGQAMPEIETPVVSTSGVDVDVTISDRIGRLFYTRANYLYLCYCA